MSRSVYFRLALSTGLAAGALYADCLDVLVRDPDRLAVQNALVSAGEQSSRSDAAGVARLCGVDPSAALDVTVEASGFAIAIVASRPGESELTVELELSGLRTPVVVTGVTEPRELAEVDRSLTVLSVDNRDSVSWSFADLLKQDSSVHLHERGPDGTQADLSIRGAGFDQALVMINGVRVSDSQTGHHSLDLPLPLESVRQVEVLKGSGATLYGSDAIGGAINFVTRKPEGRELRLMSGVGQHGWNRLAASGGFRKDIWSQTLSLSRDFSSGFAAGRDFRNLAFASETFLDSSLGSTSVMFAVNDRPFGANGFYGPWDSWEKTGTKFVSAAQTLGRGDKLQQRFNFAFRRHNDNFILCKFGCVFGDTLFDPLAFQNLHQLDTYQGSYSVNGRVSERVGWSGGLQYLSEAIDSTVAGQRKRDRASAFVMLNLRPTDRMTLALGLREEVWKKWRGQTSPTVAAGYRLGSGFKLRGQIGNAFRIPTYTDLYHRDPGNVGNPLLVPENAWNYELGGDWYSAFGSHISATWFNRQENNTIDWIRDEGSAVFQARNFQQLSFNGVELELRQRLPHAAEIWLNYTGIEASRLLAVDAVSRYVFNFPQNNLVAGYRAVFAKHLLVKTQLGVYNRSWQSARGLWDLSFAWTQGRWQPFIQGSNLTDTSHQAFQGLRQPGRWLRGGVQWQLF